MGEFQVYGHEKTQTKLTNLFKNKQLNSSLLFLGLSHIGKKQVALSLAQTILCDSKQPPCGKCPSCLKRESHESLLLIEPDGINLKLEIMDHIRSFIKLQSFSAHRVIIIDQAHLMNVQTQNAFLKILEEPPRNIYFILVCDRTDLLLKTIQSRVTKYRFYPLSLENLKKTNPHQTEEILRASRGQLNRIQQWEGKEDLFKEVFLFWQNLLKGKRISKSLLEKLRDRKTACLVAQVWQEILRDVRFYQEGSQEWIHLHQKELYQKMSQLPHHFIESFYQKALYLEKDVRSYLNCLLCFENYWHQAHQHIHGNKS